MDNTYIHNWSVRIIDLNGKFQSKIFKQTGEKNEYAPYLTMFNTKTQKSCGHAYINDHPNSIVKITT